MLNLLCRQAVKADLPEFAAATVIASEAVIPTVTRRVRRTLSPSIALVAVLAATLAAGLGTTTAMAASLPDFSQLVEQQGDTVVSITTIRQGAQPTAGDPQTMPQLPDELRRFFEQDPRGQSPDSGPGQGIGSGFIVSDDGYVVTNAHVVNGASQVSITLDDRRQLSADLVGLDEATDIALLKVDAKNLPTVELGNSDEVRVGEWVLAIGSPFGLDHTATQGIVSAVARNLPSGGYAPFIQTDVAVNPGNSGGPLFNTDGQVIGVNSQIYSRSGGYQGLSFAIPINVAMHVVEQLKSSGQVSRGWLGVAIQDVDQALADAFGLDKPTGALVSNVSPDSPAAAAGVESGDIITAFNGRAVTHSGDLPALVAVIAAGDKASITLLRDGKPQTLDVTIGEFATQKVAMNGASLSGPSRLGLLVESLDAETLKKRGLEHGVRVLEVKPDSPAAQAAIMADDVIVSVNGKAVGSPAELDAIDAELNAGTKVAVLLMRGDRSLYVALDVPAPHQ